MQTASAALAAAAAPGRSYGAVRVPLQEREVAQVGLEPRVEQIAQERNGAHHDVDHEIRPHPGQQRSWYLHPCRLQQDVE